jgi:hypothetical protein
MNPVPHEDAAADIAKMFEQNLQQKSEFREKRFSQTSANTQFSLFVCIPGVFDKFWLKIGNFYFLQL